MKTKTIIRSLLAVLLVAVMLLSAVGCSLFNKPNGEEESSTNGGDVVKPEVNLGHKDPKVYTYNTYLVSSPSNWNELTYQDANDTEIMSYIGSSFFTFDYKYDENGLIVPGMFEIEYSAATKLEDVTADYVGEKWGITEGEIARAWKITLRDDLQWENGVPIKAEDFVYTMQQQLDPLFQNYRADSFYVGATIIANAQGYAKQGQKLDSADNGAAGIYSMADLVKGEDGVYTQPDGAPVYFALTEALDWCGGNSVADYAGAGYLNAEAFEALSAIADAETGRVAITDETIALWTTLITTEMWGEDESYLYNYLVFPYTYPEVKWEDVGMFVGLAEDGKTENELEIVIVLEKALDLVEYDENDAVVVDENGDPVLSYKAAYNMASLPLVYQTLYEACKKAPTEGVDLWTTNYNTSVETTMSWGPYKLESFQAGKQHVIVRNDNWYGYNMEENDGLYQTDRIVCDIVPKWASAWVKFQAGELDGIGIDVSIADDYKTSDRAYFTPDDYVDALQLQSNAEALKSRETEGVNKTMLTYADFRKALSLSINRADYTLKCTTSNKAGFGLFNTMHYYDVANGGVYRDTDDAKQVLCDIYGVNVADYESLDAAVDAITGYDLEQARELVNKAYAEALANGDIKATDKIVLTFGTSVINDNVTRRVNYIKTAWQELVKGTPLEGRIDVETKEFSNAWAEDFRAGAYDVCMGGWSGAAWDPGYFLLAYLSPAYMYSMAWDSAGTQMTFTMKGVGENGEDITETMGLLDWYNCLNGASGAKYNWSSTGLEESQRLQLIAALEREVLKVYYTVPVSNSFGASLISYKVDYISYEYNTFMGYGGMKYMTYNYDDTAWAAAVAEQNGQLNYK